MLNDKQWEFLQKICTADSRDIWNDVYEGLQRLAWRPIEEAPRDGSEILLSCGNDCFAGFWHDGSGNYWKKAGFYEESDRSSLISSSPENPTHWMHLPPTPKEGE